MANSDLQPPPRAGSPQGSAVARMFGGIAGRYDLANHVLSGGWDYYWRYYLVRLARRRQPRRVVDLATGSGDVAFALRRGLGSAVEVAGYDFCLPMLEEAEKKKARSPRYADLVFTPGDCLDLPLPDATVDLLTIAFGLRNLADRTRGLDEMRRVLRPGGVLLCLEFSQPWPVVRPFYRWYNGTVLPRLAGWLTGDPDAYRYLNESIAAFPDADALTREFRATGFGEVHLHRLTGGIVAIHEAVK